jgi:cellulose synthase/poly-beta-1,6-N-acetylglucosamine synthase-like glycosyltransferase
MLVLAAYVLGTGGILCLMVNYLAQIRRHCELVPAGRAAEQRALATPLPPAQLLPHVVVQIVSFNEGALVRRALQAAARLDWPKDRLHIQLLDDSTDDTPGIARAAVAELRAAGLDIVMLHRERRDNFKAGALAVGMAASPHEYFAIFDTDYVPPANFLQRCMAVLLAERRYPFVQARIDYLNANENALTRSQMVMLDHHMSVDQMTRSWSRDPLPFNGTCGIWRRSAIEAAGGWRGDTLAEDLDLSYRVWMLGLSGVFLSTVAVPGELPASLEAWTNQQYRWTTGFGQVAWRVLPMLASARVYGFQRKLSAFRHLGPAIAAPFVTTANLSLLALLLLQPGWALPLLATAGLLLLLCFSTMVIGLAVGQRTVRRSLPRGFMVRCLHVMALQLRLGWVLSYRSVRKTLGGEHLEFVRTPKRGGLHSREPDKVA